MQVSARGFLTDETVIARIPLNLDVVSPSEMEMKLKPTFGIGFVDGIASGEDIVDVLSGIYNYIASDVVPVMEPLL